MSKEEQVGRRDFLKTSSLAGMAATLPAASLFSQENPSLPKARPQGNKRKLLLLSDAPKNYEQFANAIRSSIKEYDLTVSSAPFNYQKPQEIVQAIQDTSPDLVLMCTPSVMTSTAQMSNGIGYTDVPIVLLPPDPELIMLEADLVAGLRTKGTTALLANSQARAIELLKVAAAPRVLEGRRAVIFGNPFRSASVPTPDLNEDLLYKTTGVKLQYRPIDELKPLLETVDEAKAKREMERWKKEAVSIVEASDKAILDTSRLYVLLRSIVDKENLSAISIDCLSFTFSSTPTLPYPCLAFTRLRDEGIAAPCEADVCGSLTSMVLQKISQRPSYICNVSGVNTQKSTTVLRHCVAPTKLMGPNAPAQPYNLRDYHGMGRGVTPEVEFPTGIPVTMGAFSKDLKDFVLWPGKTIPRVKDTDRPSFPNMPSSKMRKYCSNHLEVKIKDVDSFLQKIAGCHIVMVAGTYTNDLRDAMLRMNVNVIGPTDSSVPEA
jgi:L-fucose isomerase-like protein